MIIMIIVMIIIILVHKLISKDCETDVNAIIV